MEQSDNKYIKTQCGIYNHTNNHIMMVLDILVQSVDTRQQHQNILRYSRNMKVLYIPVTTEYEWGGGGSIGSS
jgi:hypothetical protein